MNTKRFFNNKATIYDKFRPQYAPEFYEYISTHLGIGNSHIFADVGSGTGLFCEYFIHSGSTVFAIEPNKDMRIFAQNKFKYFSNFHSMEGDDSNIKLNNNSVDVVTVAQAFHYFDVQNFRNECIRILKDSKSHVLIVWNRKIFNDLDKERRKIAEMYCPLYSEFNKITPHKDKEKLATEFFRNASFFNRVSFENNIMNTYDEFINRTLSAYYAPKEGEKHFENYKNALTKYFEKYSLNGLLTVPNETIAFIGSFSIAHVA